MPRCYYCDKETPTTRMILVREYDNKTGTFWYFCSFFHLLKWLEDKLLKGRKEGVRDENAYLERGQHTRHFYPRRRQVQYPL